MKGNRQRIPQQKGSTKEIHNTTQKPTTTRKRKSETGKGREEISSQHKKTHGNMARKKEKKRKKNLYLNCNHPAADFYALSFARRARMASRSSPFSSFCSTAAGCAQKKKRNTSTKRVENPIRKMGNTEQGQQNRQKDEPQRWQAWPAEGRSYRTHP